MSFLLIMDICVSASFGWLLFLRDSKFGSTQYWASATDENQFMIMMILFSFIEIVVLMLISANLSLFLSQGKALMASFLVIILFKLIENVETIKNYIPTDIGNLSSAMELSGNSFWNEIARNGFVFLIYITFLVVVLIRRYNRMDYVR